MTNASPSRKLQALILAGWRNESREDPLSQVNSVHKAFIDIGGIYMIERVIQTLQHIDSIDEICISCLLYTSPSPRDRQKSRMPSSA